MNHMWPLNKIMKSISRCTQSFILPRFPFFFPLLFTRDNSVTQNKYGLCQHPFSTPIKFKYPNLSPPFLSFSFPQNYFKTRKNSFKGRDQLATPHEQTMCALQASQFFTQFVTASNSLYYPPRSPISSSIHTFEVKEVKDDEIISKLHKFQRHRREMSGQNRGLHTHTQRERERRTQYSRHTKN